MSSPLIFQDDVRADVDSAYSWYQGQRDGLGEEFLAELDVVFDRLARQPLVHQVIRKDVRRALLKRFPYSVYYRARSSRVEIVAVMFSRRDPAAWHARADAG